MLKFISAKLITSVSIGVITLSAITYIAINANANTQAVPTNKVNIAVTEGTQAYQATAAKTGSTHEEQPVAAATAGATQENQALAATA